MHSTSLTVIHKYIRREMFDFAERLFRAGPEDVPAIAVAFEKLAALLEEHAAREDAKLAPPLRELEPALAERLDRDHRRLQDRVHDLRRSVQELDPRASSCAEALLRLHLDWNLYLSMYLAHLDAEERSLFARVAEHLPPVEAIAETARAQGPQQGGDFLLRIWSVTTCRERRAIEDAQQLLARR
jgi:hypothetical protein